MAGTRDSSFDTGLDKTTRLYFVVGGGCRQKYISRGLFQLVNCEVDKTLEMLKHIFNQSSVVFVEPTVPKPRRSIEAMDIKKEKKENFPSLHSRRDNSQRNRVVDWSKYLEALFHCPSTWGSVQVTTPKVTSPITIQLLRFVAEKMRKATPTSSAALKSGSSFFLAWPAGFISWEQGGAGPTWRNFTWHTQFTVLCLLL